MNLELPFTETDEAALDEYLAAIDEELDALFLDEVNGVLQRIRAERDVAPDTAAA
ncbi:MAG TPA: hypothetical protein VFL83_11230 [Anaeromyxobacter sp.]|nr:hypothetical protein [Anaeromyxobacter sp.]